MFASYHTAIYQVANYYNEMAIQYADVNYEDQLLMFLKGAIFAVSKVYGVNQNRVKEDIRKAIQIFDKD
jgi:hypothetical protein